MKELYRPLEIEIIQLTSGNPIENSGPSGDEWGEDIGEIDQN